MLEKTFLFQLIWSQFEVFRIKKLLEDVLFLRVAPFGPSSF